MNRVSEFKIPAAVILLSALLLSNFVWCLPVTNFAGDSSTKDTKQSPDNTDSSISLPPIFYNESLAEITYIAAAEGTWTCGNCGTENPPSSKYCSECGTKKLTTAESNSFQDMRICPKCGFVNDRDAKFCGDCGAPLAAAGTTGMVFVPGKGYFPKGAMIEPPHARTSMWLTGLIVWLLAGPGIVYAGVATESLPLYIMGGLLTTGGLIMFIVGLAVKTDPVYAFHPREGSGVFTAQVGTLERLPTEDRVIKTELVCLTF